MKPFRATYTPVKTIVENDGQKYSHITYQPEPENARIVLIVAFQDEKAIFIDADNTLKFEDALSCFTNCQSSEWRE